MQHLAADLPKLTRSQRASHGRHLGNLRESSAALAEPLSARKQECVIETRRSEHAVGKRYVRAVTQQAAHDISTARVGIGFAHPPEGRC